MTYEIKHEPSDNIKNGDSILTIVPSKVKHITAEDVDSLYDGREGCRCGCGGTYYEAKDNLRKINNVLKKMASGKYLVESIEDYIFNITINEDRRTVKTIYLIK